MLVVGGGAIHRANLSLMSCPACVCLDAECSITKKALSSLIQSGDIHKARGETKSLLQRGYGGGERKLNCCYLNPGARIAL